MKAEMFKIEIIQDFNSEDNSLEKHIDSVVTDAKNNKCPEHLRICKQIQTDKCEKLDDKKVCECVDYKIDKFDAYNLKCQNCGHLHKNITSYIHLDR